MGFDISYFLRNSNDCLDASTVLLWLFLEPMSGEHTSIPPWIPMQNLQCLTSVKRVFNKLGLNNAPIPFQLKELVIDMGEFTVSLNQFLKSLEKLNQLEDLVLHGNTLDFPLIEVGSLSQSLGKFTSLRRLILSQFRTSIRELSFNNNDESFTLKPQTSSLAKIVIRQGKRVSKTSICGDYYPGLKSLHILEMPSLKEVDLTQLTSLVCLELKYCYDLEEFSCLSHLSCLEKITIDGCWELEELSFANLSCLESITINGCWMLRNVTDYEGLDQLKYLQLSAIYNRGIILNCIRRFQRLPSRSTIISGHAEEGAESILNANLFFREIDVDAVNRIGRNELGVFEVSLNTAYSLGAIIVCNVVHTHVGDQIPITLHPSKSIVTTTGTRTSIITVVITNQNELCHAPIYLTQSYWMPNMTFHSSSLVLLK